MGKNFLLRWELSEVTLIDHVSFQFSERHPHPAALSWALKCSDSTLDDGRPAHQLLTRLPQLRQLVILFLTPDASVWLRRLVGALVASDSLADEALARLYAPELADLARHVVQLVAVSLAYL